MLIHLSYLNIHCVYQNYDMCIMPIDRFLNMLNILWHLGNASLQTTREETITGAS